MRLSISNIAWDVSEDAAMVDLLHRYGVDAIDVAPGKYLPDLETASSAEIERVRRWWVDRGIEITGMQALLFGTSGLNLFGDKEVQKAMLDRLDLVFQIASALGAPRLVFGCPKNRDRTGLSDREAKERAIDFFKRLGESAERHNVLNCIEPNPPIYGCNFMTTLPEAAEIVAAVDHPHIRLHIDTGELKFNHHSPEIIREFVSLIGHIQASEPSLVPLGEGGAEHESVGKVLKEVLPHHVVSIEMLATPHEPHLEAIERALQVAIKSYKDQGEAQ